MNYLDPTIPAELRVVDVPVIAATSSSIRGFGQIVRDPRAHKVEIVKWPLRGWRKLDEGTGDGAVPSRVPLWHANYHPDGGRLFWSLDGQPFVVPVAPPGDDVKAEVFVALRLDGSFGIYIHPDIWHEGVFPVAPSGRFFDKRGRVHARVSRDMASEPGALLSVRLV